MALSPILVECRHCGFVIESSTSRRHRAEKEMRRHVRHECGARSAEKEEKARVELEADHRLIELECAGFDKEQAMVLVKLFGGA